MQFSLFVDARILIVDDEIANVRLLEIILQQAGFTNVRSTTDARQVASLLEAFHPDVLLLDLMMPHLNGFQVMERVLATLAPGSYLPILVMTADASAHVRQKALSSGAKDFLTKPFDATEVLLRLNNLLEVRFQHLLLESKVRERTRELEEAQRETLQRLALAAEYRDDDTGLHTKRVGAMAGRLAARLGWPREKAALLAETAALHDIGKIAIPDAILLKNGRLTPAEFTIMQTHTVVGARLLSGSASPWLRLAEEIARTHHEHWDGNGYMGLQGEAIPLSGRIVAVADVFDALTHERPYKRAWSLDDSVAEIRCQSGRHFDPEVVEAFLWMMQGKQHVQVEYAQAA